MCKQLKENLSQTFMSSMKSVIDTLDEHSKSIKELDQRIKQLSAKGSGVNEREDVEFTIESATPGDRSRYDAEDGVYRKFVDSEHPELYVIVILKSPYEKGTRGMCHALLSREPNGVYLLYVSDDTLSAPRSNYSRGFCNLISKSTTFSLRETFEETDITREDVEQINDYIKKVGYTVDFNIDAINTPFRHSVFARLNRPLFKTPKQRRGKYKEIK